MKIKEFIKNYGMLCLIIIGFALYGIFVMPTQLNRGDIIMESFNKLGYSQ